MEFKKQLFKCGNSLVICVDKVITNSLDLEKGGYVKVSFSKWSDD